MIFDRKLKDFKLANINSAKKQWNLCKKELNNIDNYYNKKETINQLKNTYENYFGKSGNRKLLRDNKKLYLSLYYHTKYMDSLNKNLNKFSMRLYILTNNIETYCTKHQKLKFWKFQNGEFQISCKFCKPKYPSKEWFKLKYGSGWKKYIQLRKDKLRKIRTNSLNWYINKYGENEGKLKYELNVVNKIQTLTKLQKNRYSKISQDLFWGI